MTLNIPILTTDRLTLRGPQADDFTCYAEIFSSNRSRHMGGPLPRDAAWKEFAADNFAWLIYGFGYWTVVENSTGSNVGMVGLAKPPEYPERELGWMVHPDFESKGYAFEAAVAARKCAYQVFNWNTAVSYIDHDNTRSIALAERLGCTIDENAKRPDDNPLVYRHPAPGAIT